MSGRSSMAALVLSAELAVRDILYQWLGFLVSALSCAAVLTPLMILYGLKFGIVSSLTAQLLEDPRNLQILIVGNTQHQLEWIDNLRARPDVGFVIPHTRSLAAVVDVRRPDREGGLMTGAILATADGDPLLRGAAAPVGNDQAVISRSLADALDLDAGDDLELITTRQTQAGRNLETLTLHVIGVLDRQVWEQRGMLLPLPVLSALESWRDGFAVPELGWDGDGVHERSGYASFRIYAADFDAIRPLAQWLGEAGLDVRTRLADVESVQALDHSLSAVFAIIAGVTLSGFVFAMSGMLWNLVEQRRRDLAVLRLQGQSRRAAIVFPVVQGLLVAALGTVLAFVLYAAAQTAINRYLGTGLGSGEVVCRLETWHFVAAACTMQLIALVAVMVAALRVARIDPGRGLSHD
jgi:putative ABC transport system permease protein